MITLVAVAAAPLVLALLLGAANAILAASASKTTCAPARARLLLCRPDPMFGGIGALWAAPVAKWAFGPASAAHVCMCAATRFPTRRSHTMRPWSQTLRASRAPSFRAAGTAHRAALRAGVQSLSRAWFYVDMPSLWARRGVRAHRIAGWPCAAAGIAHARKRRRLARCTPRLARSCARR